MGVSTSSSEVIYESLKASGVRLMSALPETWLVHLVRMAEDDPDMTLVRLAKEEEGVGISMGAHLAGVRSASEMREQPHITAPPRRPPKPRSRSSRGAAASGSVPASRAI